MISSKTPFSIAMVNIIYTYIIHRGMFVGLGQEDINLPSQTESQTVRCTNERGRQPVEGGSGESGAARQLELAIARSKDATRDS